MRSKLTVGQTVKIYIKPGRRNFEGSSDKSQEKIVWGEINLPVKITAEYPSVYIGTVLEHWSPHGFDKSKPWTICINKKDLLIGKILVNGKQLAQDKVGLENVSIGAKL